MGVTRAMMEEFGRWGEGGVGVMVTLIESRSLSLIPM